MKKVLSIFLLVTLLFCFMPTFVACNGDGLEYVLNDDRISYSVQAKRDILSEKVLASGDIVIPDTYNNLPVTKIARDAFLMGDSITSITIPNSIHIIGDSAFQNCIGLKSVTIPDSVTIIGGNAFQDCESLASITIPNSMTSIKGATFSGCNSLTSVIIPKNVIDIGISAFARCNNLINITVDINNKNFSSQDGILYDKNKSTLVACPAKISGTFFILSSVKNIGDTAFYGCSNLTSITIPYSVKSIGKYAFAHCSGLTTINFGGSKIDWQHIGKGFAWKEVTGEYTIICTDGTISKSQS